MEDESRAVQGDDERRGQQISYTAQDDQIPEDSAREAGNDPMK